MGAYVSSHPQPGSSHFPREVPYARLPAPQSVTVKQKSSKAKTAATLGLGTAGVTALFMTADGADDTADAVEDWGDNRGERTGDSTEDPGGMAATLPGYIGPVPQ